MSTVNQEKKSNPQTQQGNPNPQDSGAKRTTAAPGARTNEGQNEWNQAADKAKDAAACATEMAGHAASAVGTMASQAACDVGKMATQAVTDVGKQADDLVANAGAGIQGWGDTLAKNTPQSGVLGNASQAVARTVKESGEYLHDAKLSGLAQDVTLVIKRNPIPAVCIALGLGWLVASRLRS